MPASRAFRATLPAINNNRSTAQNAQNGLRSAVEESLKTLVNEEFECPICLETCTDTRTNPECLNRFCGHCVNESIRRCTNECPSCRVYIPTKRTLREDKKFDQIVSESVRCTNSIPCIVDILLTGRIIVAVGVIVGRRRVEFYKATRNRWSFLIVLSVNTRNPMPAEVVDWSLLAWVNYIIIRRATSKAPVNCAAAPDVRKESHSYVCQSEILLLGSGKVTAELPQNS